MTDKPTEPQEESQLFLPARFIAALEKACWVIQQNAHRPSVVLKWANHLSTLLTQIEVDPADPSTGELLGHLAHIQEHLAAIVELAEQPE